MSRASGHLEDVEAAPGAAVRHIGSGERSEEEDTTQAPQMSPASSYSRLPLAHQASGASSSSGKQAATDSSTIGSTNLAPSYATTRSPATLKQQTPNINSKQSARRNTSLSNSIRRLLTFVRNPAGQPTSTIDPNNNNTTKSRSSHKSVYRRGSNSGSSIKTTKASTRFSDTQEESIQHKPLVQKKSPSITLNMPTTPIHNYPILTNLSASDSQAQVVSESPHRRKSSLRSSSGGGAAAASEQLVSDTEGLIGYVECKICLLMVEERNSPKLVCKHRVCLVCMQRYITTEINNSRLNITCPVCTEQIHPNDIKYILDNEKLYLKYESFMLRRVLAAEPDARWCPAPDCSYVVLASGCASCPKLVCARPGCSTSFCYHCKQEWHPDQTCRAASIKRNNRSSTQNLYHLDVIEKDSSKSSSSHQLQQQRVDDIKECPVCGSRIVKMNDGSCNHMTCSICEAQFCWLCMKEISDLHYFSPSGCTFWGKKPWSRKKKLFWQLGMLIGAPICIILIAGVAVPAIVVGIPVWAARKLKSRLEQKQFSRYRKNAIITGGVILSLVVSPFISAVALAIGVPFLLGYVYGVVPLSLCRSSSGCLSSKPSLENFHQAYQSERIVTSGEAQAVASLASRDGTSIDTALSHKIGDPSIGETSLHMSDISLDIHDRESASNAALAGSILSHVVEDENQSTIIRIYGPAALVNSKESAGSVSVPVPAEVYHTPSITSEERQ